MADNSTIFFTNNMKTYTQEELISLRNHNEDWLMEQPGIIGSSIGIDAKQKIVLRIYTKDIEQATKQIIKNKFSNVPIAWEEGDVVPQ